MGKTKSVEPVQLVVGILAKDPGYLELARKVLIQKFGKVDCELTPIPFRWTNYYIDEIGSSPLRCILSFEILISRETLPEIKLWTNSEEDRIAEGGPRPVNLDPGYMTMGQFFLATTKDQRQRVYIRDGIFVEPTLYFQDGSWKAFDWTYRDWQSEEYLQFFQIARQRLAYKTTTRRPWADRKNHDPRQNSADLA